MFKLFSSIFGSEDPSRRRSAYLRDTIRNYTISFQSNRYPSCESIVMDGIERMIRDSYDEFAEWDDSEDYNKIALTILYNTSFDIVATGKYHIYYGVLSPIGKQLQTVCRSSLEKAFALGYIDKEALDDQVSVLTTSVANIG